ncbi:GntR family transcriptional regulator [Wenxinia saemankumensis]|uniref:Transcriptional regulator, GntR family n=1 Tax=Wenxinia saemankumensis TaxID=1447782 RepID=A0A1M6B3I5_9RHOB|nr:GntR family transcriptional regulator [Wenxinia saemankumensis]SHI43312.1 transcriptional regulator, GntR family [Wenxinia saemankumensis]
MGDTDGDRARPRADMRARIVHSIADGSLGAGDALPSVRELAAEAGVAPMTVSKVYAQLRAAGLVESRPGSGTFVAPSALARLGASGADRVWSDLDAAIDRALDAGLSADDVTALFAARILRRTGRARPARVVVVGLFEDATRSYARRIAAQLGEAASVGAVTLGVQPGQVPAETADRLREAEIILTFAALVGRVEALGPAAPIVALRFIPSEETRMALASIDPMARVAVVSRFADYLPVLELGVRRFAPHVADVTVTQMETGDVAATVEGRSVVVMSTGAEAAAERAPAATHVEYRHVPDPADVDRLVRPLLDRMQADAPERKDAR